MSNQHAAPPRRAATVTGRLNLEQQRKRAKDLLKALRGGEPPALARAARHLPRSEQPPRLSDAQHVIARECGFDSWPRLKAHIDALDFARRHGATVSDRDLRTLHVRCGSDIRHALQIAGFSGDFLEFADPFCIGPVPDLPLDDYLPIRAAFLAQAFGLREQDALARLRREYDGLRQAGGYQRIVLWCEHDSYDQLSLAYVLSRLGQERPRPRVELISVDAIPGVARFVGIGQLAPDLLAWLWPQRVAVSDAQFDAAARAWACVTAASPQALDKFVREPRPALPMLNRALRRHLRELPDPSSGLGLSERLALTIVAEAGTISVERAFSELTMQREPLPYLGDLMFWWLLQPLLTGAAPLLQAAGGDLPWPKRELRLTAAGREVLAGRRNWLALAETERWVGGVRIPGDRGSWCFDVVGETVMWRAAPE